MKRDRPSPVTFSPRKETKAERSSSPSKQGSAYLPAELWNNVLHRVKDVPSLLNAALVRKDYLLHGSAMRCIRGEKLGRLYQAVTAVTQMDWEMYSNQKWTKERQRLVETLLGHLDIRSDEIPKALCNLLKHCHRDLANSSVTSQGLGKYRLELMPRLMPLLVIPVFQAVFRPGGDWLMRIGFAPADRTTGPHGYEVVIQQNQLIHCSHEIGPRLTAFFQTLKFRTRLLRRRGDGSWDDDVHDQDYIQEPVEDSESELDSEGESEDCPHCGYVAAVCKCEFCPRCQTGLNYCLCEFCSVCKYAQDDCIGVH